MKTTLIRTALALFLLGTGCAHNQPSGRLRVHGALTQGAECPLLVASDGKRYSLTGSLGRFTIGDHVCVRGTLAEASICMAGDATLAIESIGPESDCP